MQSRLGDDFSELREQVEKQVERLAELKEKRDANPSELSCVSNRLPHTDFFAYLPQTSTTASTIRWLRWKTSNSNRMAHRTQGPPSLATLPPRRLKPRAERRVSAPRGRHGHDGEQGSRRPRARKAAFTRRPTCSIRSRSRSRFGCWSFSVGPLYCLTSTSFH